MFILLKSKKYFIHNFFRCAVDENKVIRYFSKTSKKCITFDEIQSQRKEEAERSIVVNAKSNSYFKTIYAYCSMFADIKSVHYYKNSAEEPNMIIEFFDKENVKQLLNSRCSYHNKQLVLPTHSPFLWFDGPLLSPSNHVNAETKKLTVQYSNTCMQNDTLSEHLNDGTLSEQIQVLYNKTKLSDIDVRLRYILARQLELLMENIYPHATVQPFGSSVNGFGKTDSDLDLEVAYNYSEELMSSERLLKYEKNQVYKNSNHCHKHLGLLANLLELRATGVSQVHRILSARVPIVKYSHNITDLECDLSFNNKSAVFMSELLWLYGSLDDRVRPLVFVIRSWAKSMGLTKYSPGFWITNFSLSLMVLFFFQQKRINGKPLLPTLKYLKTKAEKEDVRIDENNITCTFLRDFSKLDKSEHDEIGDNMGTLLFDFFEYYSQFDFLNHGICLIEGSPIEKPHNSPLYIVNPLNDTLNVSRNISFEECTRIQREMRNAAYYLESTLDRAQSGGAILINLIVNKNHNNILLHKNTKGNLLKSIGKLFEDTENGSLPKENQVPDKLSSKHSSPTKSYRSQPKKLRLK